MMSRRNYTVQMGLFMLGGQKPYRCTDWYSSFLLPINFYASSKGMLLLMVIEFL